MVYILENLLPDKRSNFNWQIDGILPKGPYPPCLRMVDRPILAEYPRNIGPIFQEAVCCLLWVLWVK